MGLKLILLPGTGKPLGLFASVGSDQIWSEDFIANARVDLGSNRYQKSRKAFVRGRLKSGWLVTNYCFEGFANINLALEMLKTHFYYHDSLEAVSFPLDRFYREVCGDDPPDDFFRVGAEVVSLGCYGDYTEYQVSPRVFSVYALQLANTGQSPLNLQSLTVKHHQNVQLSPSLTGGERISWRPDSGPIRLDPGESILFPTSIGFKDTPIFSPMNEVQDLPEDQLKAVLASHSHIGLRDPNGEASVKIPTKTFIKSIVRKVQPTHEVYYYGPAQIPLSAETSVAKFELSESESVPMLLSHSWGVGSCPSVYRLNEEEGYQFVDYFLTGLNAPQKEAVYQMPIPGFSGTIRIVEEDRETTHLKWLRIRYRDQHGLIQEGAPSDTVLADKDSNYYLLEHGDSIDVSFPDFDPQEPISSVWLVGEGYYIPYQKSEGD